MKIRKLFLLSTIVLLSAAVNAQTSAKEIEQYRQESENMRKEVWAWNRPEFNIRQIPAVYSTSSKVIIARHTELTADTKTKFVFLIFGGALKKSQMLSEVVRESIKLNDKAAVEEYSQLGYTQFVKKSNAITNDKVTNYIGIRVIKPNGSIKEINADDIVLTKDESKEKQARVAVPDLQPGDILDYFIATDMVIESEKLDRNYQLSLSDENPILNLSFHSVTAKNIFFKFHNYNGAPVPTVTTDEHDAVICNFTAHDIPAFERPIWISTARQLPYLRINITGGLMSDKKPKASEFLTLNSDKVLADKIEAVRMSIRNLYWGNGGLYQKVILDETKSKLKKMGLVFDKLSDEEQAAHIFYTIRYMTLLQFNVEKLTDRINVGKLELNGLVVPLFSMYQKVGLKPAVLIGENRLGVKMEEAMRSDDFESVVYLSPANKIFSLTSVYSVPFELPQEMDGSAKWKNAGYTLNMFAIKTDGPIAGPILQPSPSSSNMHTEDLKLSLTGDKSGLNVTRSTTLKGYYKTSVQRDLILYEDIYESERKEFHDEKSLIDLLEDSRKGRKVVDEVKNAFADARTKQKNAFEAEAKDWFEQDITNLKNYKTEKLGIRHTTPDFVYGSEFNMNGLVKKAGNNTIVEIGKILGDPYIVKEKQRKRELDVYMAFARTVDYNIELHIPDGYTAEGIQALDTNIQNEAASFMAKTTILGDKLLIKVRRQYLHNFEPAAKFPLLADVMDAANAWSNSKILFRKK